MEAATWQVPTASELGEIPLAKILGMLGELEQLLLLIVLRLGDDAYANPIGEDLHTSAGRRIARGSVCCAWAVAGNTRAAITRATIRSARRIVMRFRR